MKRRPDGPKQLAVSAMKRLEDSSRSESKCKVCAHHIRHSIDAMISEKVAYDDIISFASECGLQLSKSSLSRHKTNHLLTSEREALQELEDADTAVKKVLTKLVRELKRRDLRDLSTKQLVAYTQAALEVSVAHRSLAPRVKLNGEATK